MIKLTDILKEGKVLLQSNDKDADSLSEIADFLVLNRDCSRSLSFCIQNIVDHLINLKCSPLKVDKIYQTIKDLNASIQQEKIEAIIDYGLHEFVSQFIKKISSVDRDIQMEFFN